MTYELLFYIFLCGVGFTLSLAQLRSETTYAILTFFLFVTFSSITRFSGFELDFITYSIELSSKKLSVYYLREPVYWLTSRHIYQLTQSPQFTFIFYDAASFLLILKARKNLDLPQYFTYMFILFFPAIMGLNNVYRQYLTYSIFLYFISLLHLHSSFGKKALYLTASVLTHNVAALFSPLLFSFDKGRRFNPKTPILVLFVLGLLPVFVTTKSSSNTGDVEIAAYVLILLVIIIFHTLSYRMRYSGNSEKFFYLLIYMLILVSISAAFMGSAQSKRIGMFALMIALVPMAQTVEENYKQKRILRASLFISTVMPTFFFPNALNMLLTEVR